MVNYAIVGNTHGEDDVDGRIVSPSISFQVWAWQDYHFLLILSHNFTKRSEFRIGVPSKQTTYIGRGMKIRV